MAIENQFKQLRDEIRVMAIAMIYIQIIDSMRQDGEIKDELEMHRRAMGIAKGIYDGIAIELSLRP